MALFGELQQSFTLTVLCAFLSGFSLAASTACTHYPTFIDRIVDEEERKNEAAVNATSSSDERFTEDWLPDEKKKKKKRTKVSKKNWRIAVAANLFLAASAGVLQLFAAWFGPISLLTPIKMVSQITSQLIIFSYILKTEKKPDKDVRVGFYVIILSVLLFLFVGAEVSELSIEKDDLLDNMPGVIFSVLSLFIAFFICFPFQIILGCTAVVTSDRANFTLLLVTEVMVSLVGNASGKLLTILSGRAAIVNFVIFLLNIISLAYAGVLRSIFITNQSEYLPIMMIFNTLLNGLSGIILWNDVVKNIGGYVIAFLLFGMGVYLTTEFEVLLATPFQDQINANTAHDNLIIKSMVPGHDKHPHPSTKSDLPIIKEGDSEVASEEDSEVDSEDEHSQRC